LYLHCITGFINWPFFSVEINQPGLLVFLGFLGTQGSKMIYASVIKQKNKEDF